MDRSGENARGIHAMRVLDGRKDFTMDSLTAGVAFDSLLPAFESLLPPLVRDYEGLAASSPLKAKLAEPVAALKGWDYRWGVSSVPTTLAVFWGEELGRRVAADARTAGVSADAFMRTRASATARLEALAAVADKLTADFGTWKTPWGDVNRFQRIAPDIVHPFDDSKPSIPVGFTSGRWGSLASYGARSYNGSKKIYGTSGNSFVAVVEFGKDRVRAKAVTAGGQSGHPNSPHFNDQAQRYSTGDLREVYFYRADLEGHTSREYRPGK
jgi:acyl-homoserine-lactone acylase